MGPLGKDDRKRTTTIHEELDFADTQPFDTNSPSCHDDDRDEFQYFEDTVPFDDDELETQCVDLAGETQVLDIAGETQPFDDYDDDDGGGGGGGDETQLLDEFDEGVAESDSEGSGGTQVLENVDEMVEDDPQSFDTKEVETGESSGGDDNKKLLGDTDADVHQQTAPGPGSMPPRFTFLRAESLREAGLAARNMTSKETQGETNSAMGMGRACQESLALKDNVEPCPKCSGKVRQVDQCKCGTDNVEIEGFKNKNMCKVASSAVRKLFNDDLLGETDGPSLSSNDFIEGEGSEKFPSYQGEFEGLSYANSQEPGELSQANALDFVDKFLKDNIMEFDHETNHVKNVEEKSKSLPSTKGQQILAKRVNDRDKAVKTGIYDWDDSREDEGGGDILRRKGEFFYGETHRPKSVPGFLKTHVHWPNDDKDNDGKRSIPNKRKIAVHSDSKLGMRNLKVMGNSIQEAGRELKRNLANELDEQFNTNCSGGQMDHNANVDGQEILDVGLDTQMAAEAMEALCNAEDTIDHVANDATNVTGSSLADQLSNPPTGKVHPVTSKKHSVQSIRKRKVSVKADLQTSGLSKNCPKEVRQCKKDNMIMTRSKRSKLNAEDNQTSGANENGRIVSSAKSEQRKSARALKRHQFDELTDCDGNDRGNGGNSVNERQLQGEICQFTPIARRTRQSLAVNQLIKPDVPSKRLREGDTAGTVSLGKNSGIGLQASDALNPEYTPRFSDHSEADANIKQPAEVAPKASAVSVSNDLEMDAFVCRRRRSLRIRKLSNNDEGSKKSPGSSRPSTQPEDIGKSTAWRRKGSRSTRNGCNVLDEKEANLNADENNNADGLLSTNNFEVASSNESPRERYKSSDLASATPANHITPVNDASPVCMGDDYYKKSCNRNLLRVYRNELQRELHSLRSIRPELTTPSKDSRKRRDMTDVRILYSHHLDEDIIKHQKKILGRLGVSVASSVADATHFIADQFVRTRNMLEAIAFGKPVVTHLWIESCGQASCFIDEKNYILRDAKKEKEFGFCMPVSLARASKHPILEGRRVLITPNTKPSRDVIISLVKAVQGQAVERIGSSASKGHKIPDNLLILSCEEDYASCVPFLEKGAMVYSSELLLNGIVTQKLEYERHRLFVDKVKKTRSTIWLRRDDRTFLPVAKCN